MLYQFDIRDYGPVRWVELMSVGAKKSEDICVWRSKSSPKFRGMTGYYDNFRKSVYSFNTRLAYACSKHSDDPDTGYTATEINSLIQRCKSEIEYYISIVFNTIKSHILDGCFVGELGYKYLPTTMSWSLETIASGFYYIFNEEKPADYDEAKARWDIFSNGLLSKRAKEAKIKEIRNNSEYFRTMDATQSRRIIINKDFIKSVKI